MDAVGPSSSSKVIVQCTDPTGLLDAFESRLSRRTPLRNLHWKSPNRPLRSIPFLDISIIRDDRQQDKTQPNVRRHQIPGLRETPFVKLYLLRCDDKETYKEKARKEVRQWVKENTSFEGKTSVKNPEHHDAAEWMIVHLVLPDTPAASQPKSSKHISVEATESTDSLNSKSKWTGKSSSTIYDKLRADFNSNSKSQPTRVAQVRISAPQGGISAAEIEEQWQELIENLKECILKSFDTRVAQYEEDIRERDRQRSLPGWNFCTFFILKEGLARGFENVGLLDDALAVYGELEIGLDDVVKDQADLDDMEPSGALLPYSKDLKGIIRNAIDSSPAEESTHVSEIDLSLAYILDSESDGFPFDVEKRKYRDLILANQVSALDFRIYIFTRRMEILLKQAKRSTLSRFSTEPRSRDETIDLNVMADLTDRTTVFINRASGELRHDLYNAWGGRLTGKELSTQKIVIGNVVASWAWAAIAQILTYTIPLLTVELKEVESRESNRPSFNEMNSSPSTRERQSVSSTTSSPSRSTRPRSRQRTGSHSRERNATPVTDNLRVELPGEARLAAWTAKLMLMARKILEDLTATESFWSVFHSATFASRAFPNVDCAPPHILSDSSSKSEDDDDDRQLDTRTPPSILLTSLDSPTLLQASYSEEQFDRLFKLLSIHAHQLLISFNHRNAANQVLVDLARLSYYRANYRAVAQHLGGIIDQPSSKQIQPDLIEMYADSLKRLDVPDEYCRCLLRCLQSVVGASATKSEHYASELTRVALTVEPVKLPLTQLVSICEVGPTISHDAHKDGFKLTIFLQTRFEASLAITAPLRLALFSMDGDEPPRLSLKSTAAVSIGSQPTPVVFWCSESTQGLYDTERLDVEIGGLQLTHYFRMRATDQGGRVAEAQQKMSTSVMVYRRFESLRLKIFPARLVRLTEPRRLTLSLHTGDNYMKKCSIRLRAATAGLRLQIHDAKAERAPSAISMSLLREGEISVISVDGLMRDQSADIDIPYTLENYSDPSITIKSEISYEVSGEAFLHHQINKIDVILPISVKVQDFFRDEHSFSRFTITPATLVPIYLSCCRVEGNDDVCVEVGSTFQDPIVIFPKQPASWTIRLRKRTMLPSPVKQGFALVIDYWCVDELIQHSLEREFLKDLSKSKFGYAAHVLSAYLLARVKNSWTEQDLEVAALTREMEMWNIKDLDWRSTLAVYDANDKNEVSRWLTSWHESRGTVGLDPSCTPPRQLKLFVEMPNYPAIASTKLQIGLANTTTGPVPVGLPIPCELVLKLWIPATETVDGLHLTYELIASPDGWLIGGRRKGKIRAADLPRRIQLMLIPQHVGPLLLPTIDIRCGREVEKIPKAPPEWAEIPVEVHNKTISKSVVAIADFRSTTIGLPGEDGLSHNTGFILDIRHWEEEVDDMQGKEYGRHEPQGQTHQGMVTE